MLLSECSSVFIVAKTAVTGYIAFVDASDDDDHDDDDDDDDNRKDDPEHGENEDKSDAEHYVQSH